MSQKINSQQEKYEKLQAQVSEYEKQLKRLKTIITVCERNKTQNTEWINNLGFLSVNMQKFIDNESNKIKATQQDIKNLVKLSQSFIDTCMQKASNHETLIQ